MGRQEVKWAIFILTGKTLSTVDAASIKEATPNNLNVLLVAQEYDNLARPLQFIANSRRTCSIQLPES